MCNRYANRIAYRQYLDTMKEVGMPIVSPSLDHAPNLEPNNNIAPTDTAPILRPIEGGMELVKLRWGLVPWFHKKTVKEWKVLGTNARSETIQTTASFKSAFAKRRCLVPLNQFYEWTGEKGKKTKWSFSRKDEEWFCFAGIWDRAETQEGIIESYALVTVPAGPDIAEYHDRQPIVLERNEYECWLASEDSAAQLFKALPKGTIIATHAEVPSEDEDWVARQTTKGKWV